MEVTVDLSGKNIKIVNDKEINIIKDLLNKTLKIDKENIKDRPAKSTSSAYIKIRYNNNRYDIRLSDHTRQIPKDANKILSNCEYKIASKVFVIEASIFKYTPKDIVNVIQGIDKSLKKFKSKESISSIQQYVQKNYETISEENFNDCVLYPYDTSRELTGNYIRENNIKDNKYNTNYHALCSIIEHQLANLNHEL